MEKELINVHVFDPAHKSTKARCEKLYCSNSKNCSLYKKGQCTLLDKYNPVYCTYGELNKEYGYTQAARNFYKWQNKKKEEYKDYLDKLTSAHEKLAFVGDYVYLPYSFLKNYTNSLSFMTDTYFCKKEDFTIENIIKIIEFKPLSAFYEEITDFQRKYMPLFVQHLYEEYKEMYDKVAEVYPIKDIYSKISCVGRKALVKTLKINAKVYDRKNEYIWDGEKLVCNNFKAFFPVIDTKQANVAIYPTDDATIKIDDDNQVDENTKFID
jgi:hypothetical protein